MCLLPSLDIDSNAFTFTNLKACKQNSNIFRLETSEKKHSARCWRKRIIIDYRIITKNRMETKTVKVCQSAIFKTLHFSVCSKTCLACLGCILAARYQQVINNLCAQSARPTDTDTMWIHRNHQNRMESSKACRPRCRFPRRSSKSEICVYPHEHGNRTGHDVSSATDCNATLSKQQSTLRLRLKTGFQHAERDCQRYGVSWIFQPEKWRLRPTNFPDSLAMQM